MFCSKAFPRSAFVSRSVSVSVTATDITDMRKSSMESIAFFKR